MTRNSGQKTLKRKYYFKAVKGERKVKTGFREENMNL